MCLRLWRPCRRSFENGVFCAWCKKKVFLGAAKILIFTVGKYITFSHLWREPVFILSPLIMEAENGFIWKVTILLEIHPFLTSMIGGGSVTFRIHCEALVLAGHGRCWSCPIGCTAWAVLDGHENKWTTMNNYREAIIFENHWSVGGQFWWFFSIKNRENSHKIPMKELATFWQYTLKSKHDRSCKPPASQPK